jgi:hypothetical protein
MNSYIMIRRLRGPMILLLAGVIAMLDEMNVIYDFWRWFFPLLLILLGVLLLAERVVLSAGGYGAMPYPGTPYPGAQNPGAPDPRAATGFGTYPGQPEAYIAPERQSEPKKDFEGGEI